MTETDFKVGDKVEVVNIYGNTHDRRVGANGTITEVRASGLAYNVHVEDKGHSEHGETLMIYPNELKLVEPEAKFQVGDLVAFAEPENDRWQGGKAKVVAVGLPGPYSVRVEIIEGPPLNDMYREGGQTGIFKPEHLNLWEATVFKNAKGEAVEHPAHYGGDTTYEVIKVAEAWGFNENAYLFNALKYLARAGKKGDKVEDLEKLVFYVKREIALEEVK